MKTEIIHIALENLQKTTGIKGYWEDTPPLDGTLILPGQEIKLIVQIKNEIRPHQVHQLEHYQKEYKSFIVVANHIYPKAKEELRLQGITYLEANGNIFLKKNNTFLFVDTQKQPYPPNEKGNRAFTKTGLKVLLHLLLYGEDINLPQRELAKKTNVGLGNIPQIINGLKDTGYLLQLNNKTYVWEKRKELLDRWVTEYNTVLKPKLKKERYNYQGDWKEITFANKLTVWGGEAAADILTSHLRPEKLIFYTKENRIDLMKNYRLIPNPEGEIEAIEMFWKQETNQQTAPAMLIYTELLLEGGKRNKETAEIIFNEYIEPKL